MDAILVSFPEKDYHGEFAGCHRFDQTAMNIIMYREFGPEIWKNLSRSALTRKAPLFWIFQRHPTNYYYGKKFECPPTVSSTIEERI